MLNKCSCDEQDSSPFCCGGNNKKHASDWNGSVKRADGFCWQLAAPCSVLEPASWPPGCTRWAVCKAWSLCTQRLPNDQCRLPPPQPRVRAPPSHSKNRGRTLPDCLPQLLNQDLVFPFLLTVLQPHDSLSFASILLPLPAQPESEASRMGPTQSPTGSVPPRRRLYSHWTEFLAWG